MGVGTVSGKCPVCGRIYVLRRPAHVIVCDCYRFCPLCDPPFTVLMEPFDPVIMPKTYGISGFRPLSIFYVCKKHEPPYFSAQKPIEVELS